MEKCAFCGADTELYDGGVPVCLKCENDKASKSPNKRKASAESEIVLEDMKRSG